MNKKSCEKKKRDGYLLMQKWRCCFKWQWVPRHGRITLNIKPRGLIALHQCRKGQKYFLKGYTVLTTKMINSLTVIVGRKWTDNVCVPTCFLLKLSYFRDKSYVLAGNLGSFWPRSLSVTKVRDGIVHYLFGRDSEHVLWTRKKGGNVRRMQSKRKWPNDQIIKELDEHVGLFAVCMVKPL